MKKIIRSTTLLLGISFIAGTTSAQVASDAPAVTSSKQQTANTVVKSTVPVQSNAKVDNNIAGASKASTTQVAETKISTPVIPGSKLPVLSNQGGVTPVLIYTEPKNTAVVKQPVEVSKGKTGAVQTTVPGPATQIIPPGSLKSSPSTQAPVTTASAKPIEVNNNSTTGKLVPIPTLTLASGTDAAPAVVTPVANPQQIQGQPKPTEAVVTPPSTINANKAPFKQN